MASLSVGVLLGIQFPGTEPVAQYRFAGVTSMNHGDCEDIQCVLSRMLSSVLSSVLSSLLSSVLSRMLSRMLRPLCRGTYQSYRPEHPVTVLQGAKLCAKQQA